MITKEINHTELEKAITIAFLEDKNIFQFYDPHVKVETVEDIVQDILRKISHFTGATFIGIYENYKLIGYFVYRGKILISFALAIEYRVRKYLRDFFQAINKEMKKDFVVYIWKRNIRAILWLEKNGLEAFKYSYDLVKLCCPVKQINHQLN